jgi:hypothetical protein
MGGPIMGNLTVRRLRTNKIHILNKDVAAIEVVRRNGHIIHFLIDREDVEKIQRYRWFSHNGYCCRKNEFDSHWYLTWELCERPKSGYVWHHLNGDRADNRRCNLRLLPWGANNYFKPVQPNRTTGRRGISKYSSGAIVALIGSGGRRKSFKTMEEAIKARNRYERHMEQYISRSC